MFSKQTQAMGYNLRIVATHVTVNLTSILGYQLIRDGKPSDGNS